MSLSSAGTCNLQLIVSWRNPDIADREKHEKDMTPGNWAQGLCGLDPAQAHCTLRSGLHEGSVSHGQKAVFAQTEVPGCPGTLTGEKTPAQIAKQYGIHPNSVGLWQNQFLEHGPELFAQDTTVKEHEGHMQDLEQLLGKKRARSRLKNFLGRSG